MEHKETITIERPVKKQHGDIYYDSFERACSIEAAIRFNGSTDKCDILVPIETAIDDGSRIITSSGVWDIVSDKEIYEKSIWKIRCSKNQFETNWQKLEATKCDVSYGQKVVLANDEESERYMDTWVGPGIVNIVSHYDAIKNGKHVGLMSHMFSHDIPVACVGCGPSLDKNIESLKDFPGIIICVDRAYRSLRARNIKPDLVLEVDCRYDLIAEMLNVPGTENDTLVLNTCSDPKIAKNWKGKILWFLMVHPGVQFMDYILPALFPGFGGIMNAGNVGNASVLLADAMGLSPIILVGQDYGYTDGKMHAEKYDIKEDGTAVKVPTDHKGLFEKRTGKLDINNVTTYLAYRGYMHTMYALRFQKGLDIINCTEGGILSKLPCEPLADMIKKLSQKSNGKYVQAKKQIKEV